MIKHIKHQPIQTVPSDSRWRAWRLTKMTTTTNSHNTHITNKPNTQTNKQQHKQQVESLVLDFKGRHILSSAKNFQLAPPPQSARSRSRRIVQGPSIRSPLCTSICYPRFTFAYSCFIVLFGGPLLSDHSPYSRRPSKH